MRLTPFPKDLFVSGRRHLFVFAHQDDDLPIAGILHRCAGSGTAVWVTNGDGLAPMAGVSPEEYAATRRGEAVQALTILGWKPERLHFLEVSELSNYQLFIDLARLPQEGKFSALAVTPSVRRRIRDLTDGVVQRLVALVRDAEVVWTMAWQGGHVEHDLTHFLTVQAVRVVEREQGRTIPIYEYPEYELNYLVTLRYPFWKKGERHRLRITEEEAALKERVFDAYRSQAELTRSFKRLIMVKGMLSVLVGSPFTFEGFIREEEFGPVAAGIDYMKPPHGQDRLEYIGEDYKGVPVRFGCSLRPIIRAVLQG
jgi:LmbE family N-acetylglucosaminyl deacetylase